MLGALPHNRMKLNIPFDPLYKERLIAVYSLMLYLNRYPLSHYRYAYKLVVLATILLNYRYIFVYVGGTVGRNRDDRKEALLKDI